jgi:hypothetical protein
MGFKRGNTTSTLFTKIDKIITLLVNEINNDEIIKRYLVFLTKQPLATRSTDNNNTMIYQSDLPKRIDSKITYITSKEGVTPVTTRTSEQILFAESYSYEKINSEYPTLFVHNYSYDCNSIIAPNVYMIDILIPSMYINVQSAGSTLIENRLHKIMERIAYLFDKVETDDISSADLGNLEFRIVGKPTEEKVNKTNDITVTTIAIETKVINARTDSTNGVMKSGYL